MKLRGLRTINIICLILCIISMIFTLIVIFIISIIHTFIVYNNFVKSYQFSTVPFWKDNRTINQKPLLPLLKVEDVNLSNFTIVIASCCRNVRKNLVGFQQNIYAITALFGNYRIYFGESDSHDGTLNFLNEWRKNDSDHVRVYSSGQQRWLVPSRTVRIASCRNTLLQKAREELSSFDYYLVIDVDVGSSPSFEIKDFLSNFIYERFSWIAMTATQRSEYYDIWALRIKYILPYDCWQRIRELTSFFIDQSYITERLVKIHQEPIPRNISLIEVESAFGGAALYDAKYLNNDCSYEGKNEHRWWWNNGQCEHVSFHRCIQQYANKQKIYINPQFQIC
ncbi:unnamed protein product [Rotaria sordida]|uniref:Uncharacterized protein n=1 Tax=Rotaria sordida TaxID=392033 RepID=A0A814RHH0_9BILA|nr:unnamed protein product [Rotaria sordida]